MFGRVFFLQWNDAMTLFYNQGHSAEEDNLISQPNTHQVLKTPLQNITFYKNKRCRRDIEKLNKIKDFNEFECN